ncbi:myelin-oligodendrocyte glycoprotein-like isoform X2 [Petaurus breviceps papuanus]|uniref:myelin-oligodendrocyte glycoprotein-like isoform X2 n=1 Tax=Petaurus breviceps papuanus TaxID=3040969 RepID=UPI0036D9D7F5
MEMSSPFGASLSNSIIAFLLLLQISQMALGEFSVTGPAGPIQAPLGGEAELPCYLSPPQSAQHMEVVWLQSTQVVHLYQDGEDQFGDQAPSYQGRTELARDAITSGNVTLKIRDVRLLDAGKYTCLIADGFYQEQADMELKVLGKEPESSTKLPKLLMQLIVFWVLMFLLFFIFMLRFQVCFLRSFPWLCEINGILIVTCAFEVEMAICYLWMRHKCRGFLYKELSIWQDRKFKGAVLMLVTSWRLGGSAASSHGLLITEGLSVGHDC